MKTYITRRTGETLESNMGDIHTWPVEYELSKHAISELEKIDELVGIQYLVACIAAVGKFYGQRPLDAEFVTGLQKVRESLMHAASTLESLGPWAARVILTPDGIYNNRRGGYYFEWEDRSYHLDV